MFFAKAVCEIKMNISQEKVLCSAENPESPDPAA